MNKWIVCIISIFLLIMWNSIKAQLHRSGIIIGALPEGVVVGVIIYWCATAFLKKKTMNKNNVTSKNSFRKNASDFWNVLCDVIPCKKSFLHYLCFSVITVICGVLWVVAILQTSHADDIKRTKVVIDEGRKWPRVTEAAKNIANNICANDRDTAIFTGYSQYITYMKLFPKWCAENGVILSYPQELSLKYKNHFRRFLEEFDSVQCNYDAKEYLITQNKLPTDLIDQIKLSIARVSGNNSISDDMFCRLLDSTLKTRIENVLKKRIISLY